MDAASIEAVPQEPQRLRERLFRALLADAAAIIRLLKRQELAVRQETTQK